MSTLTLSNADARLVYLATIYHLGRPGSETSGATLQRHGPGLRPLHKALASRLDQASFEVDLSDYQLSRLGEALLGTVNELKQYAISGGRSAVPGFEQAMTRLFPDALDGDGALDLVPEVVMLRRRLETAIRGAETAAIAARETQAEEEARGRRRRWRSWAARPAGLLRRAASGWKVWRR